MSSSKPVGYAVVGLGHIAQWAVLPAFQRSRKARLVAVVSGDASKARRLAVKFGADHSYTYESYSECLSNPQVEAVFIATNNSTHAEYTMRAATAGKHVLCEKPLAPTVDDCLRMIEACRATGVRLMTAYRKYFEPASLALKKLVTSGRLGRLKIIHSAFTIFLGQKTPVWHFDAKLSGGGALVDVGVYCVNTARWLAGKDPFEASACSWTIDPRRFHKVEENIAFRLTFPAGLLLQASSSFGAAQASFVHLHGDKGWAALDPAFAYNEERRLFGKLGGHWFEKKFKVMDEFVLEIDAFADCIRHKRDPEPDGTQGLKDVAIMAAIYRSARENRPVRIEFPPIPPGL